MTFSATCPHCSVGLNVESKRSGDVVRCPGCKKQFRCPTNDAGVADAPPPVPGTESPTSEVTEEHDPEFFEPVVAKPTGAIDPRSWPGILSAMFLGILVVLSIRDWAATPAPSPSQTQWEYRWSSESDVYYDDNFNKHGKNGWEMVNWQMKDGKPRAIFKRRKSNN